MRAEEEDAAVEARAVGQEEDAAAGAGAVGQEEEPAIEAGAVGQEEDAAVEARASWPDYEERGEEKEKEKGKKAEAEAPPGRLLYGAICSVHVLTEGSVIRSRRKIGNREVGQEEEPAVEAREVSGRLVDMPRAVACAARLRHWDIRKSVWEAQAYSHAVRAARGIYCGVWRLQPTVGLVGRGQADRPGVYYFPCMTIIAYFLPPMLAHMLTKPILFGHEASYHLTMAVECTMTKSCRELVQLKGRSGVDVYLGVARALLS